MQQIKSLLNKYEVEQSPPKRIDYSFQALGIEMQDFFKTKQVWSLFYKHPEGLLQDAFIICKKRGVPKISYLMGVLKNLKK